MRSVMIESNQDNMGLIITSKNIDLVEILDEGIEPQVKTLLPLILRRKIADHPHQEAHALEEMSAQDVIGHGPAGARGRNDDEGARLKNREDHDRRKERVSIEHPKVEGGIPPLHHKNKNQKDTWRTEINPGLPASSSKGSGISTNESATIATTNCSATNGAGNSPRCTTDKCPANSEAVCSSSASYNTDSTCDWSLCGTSSNG